MFTISFKVTVDTTGLQHFHRDVNELIKNFAVALKPVAVRYRAFLQERYDKFSKGGGNWPMLSAATLRKRRKGRSSGHSTTPISVSILRDTGLLFNTLSPIYQGLPGQYESPFAGGVEIGIAGPARHTGGSGKKSQPTIADIARFHQFGMGHNPIREIVVLPTPDVMQQLLEIVQRALDKLKEK